MTSAATSYLAFVHTGPGLEELLAGELKGLVRGRQRPLPGGVEVRVTLTELLLVCAGSRLAEGVRVRLKPFVAKSFGELEDGLGRLPWPAYIPAGAPVEVRVTCERSRLWHSGAVRERLLGVLTRRFGVTALASNLDGSGSVSAGVTPGSVGPGTNSELPADVAPVAEASEPGSAAVRVFVRVHEDEVQVSVDAAGERLHRRGYRTMSEKASLRETLASAMLRAIWNAEGPRGVLWDPFCGAGTIPLEALSWSRGGLVQVDREFPFWNWPSVAAADRGALRASARAAGSRIFPAYPLRVVGSDISERAVRASRANLASLEAQLGTSLAEQGSFLRGDVLEVASQVPQGAHILTNPPYGHRLDASDTVEKLTSLLTRRTDLRPCALLVGSELKRDLPSTFRVVFQTQNGGLNVALRVLT